MSGQPRIHWTEAGESRSALWRSESGIAPPRRVVVADDGLTADKAYHLACEGTAMLWRGDFHNARQLLQAMARRIDRHKARKGRTGPGATAATAAPASPPRAPAPREVFNRYRLAQSQRSRTLGMLLLPFAADHGIPLPRAPDARLACAEAWGAGGEACVASLRELLGLIGAHEWRRKGIEIAAVGGRVHPHYGVFSPVRGEYVDLVAAAPLPAALTATGVAFDVGTGTGVLAAVLARRAGLTGAARIVATEQAPRALACARENMALLGLAAQVDVVEADLFPHGRAALIVCNPPWIPARPTSPLEHAIYDPDSRMLRGFLTGLSAHLAPGGEGWLILSDIAEHLGLRTRGALPALIAAAGLRVLDRIEVKPRHAPAADRSDPLHAARAAETTSLWRLAPA